MTRLRASPAARATTGFRTDFKRYLKMAATPATTMNAARNTSSRESPSSNCISVIPGPPRKVRIMK